MENGQVEKIEMPKTWWTQQDETNWNIQYNRVMEKVG